MAEIRNKTLVEVKKCEKVYLFECHADSPLGEIFDVLCEMQAFVIQKMTEASPKQAPKEVESCQTCPSE